MTISLLCDTKALTSIDPQYILYTHSQIQMQAFMDTYFENAKTVQRAIEFTQRFECLQLPCLNITEKWKLCVALFMKDIEFVQKEYNEQKESPPLARNFPPISGRIAWSRQLYHRLKEPVDVFQGHLELMALPDTRRAIKAYNRLAKILVEYEVVFLRIWNQQVDETRALLNSTLLVRHPESGQLLVNLHKKVFEMLREVDVLQMMGFPISPQARNFAALGPKLKIIFDDISVRLPLILHVHGISMHIGTCVDRVS